jgi:hypothetical protein
MGVFYMKLLKIFQFLLLFSLTDCGIDETNTSAPARNYGDLNAYVTEFIQQMTHAGITVDANQLATIQYVDLHQYDPTNRSLGVCLYAKPSYIKLSLKLEKNSLLFKWILFHELGHCLMGAYHSDNPNSLMSSFVPLTLRANKEKQLADSMQIFITEYINNEIELMPTYSYIEPQDLNQ